MTWRVGGSTGRGIILLWILVHSCLAAVCPTNDIVSLQLNWIWQAQFAGFQAASTLGYYNDECLSVQIRQGETTFNGLSEVTEGRAVFGNAWTSGVAASHSNGNDVTIVMQQFQRSGGRLLTRRRPDIQKFEDLNHKTVSTWMFNFLEVSPRAAFTKYNMNNVTLVAQSFTPFKVFATDGTAVDGVSVMAYNELAQIYEMRNPETGMLYQPEELNIYDWNELGVAMLEDNVFVRSDWLELEENRDITRRFVKATAKGWIYCRDNEDACKNMLHEHGPHQEWMMREVNRLIWPSPLGIGKMDPDALSRTLTVLSDAGELGSTPSTYPLSDSSYMEWALQSLTEEGHDTIGQAWDEPELHFCMNAGQTTFTICDALEATVCPAGSYATAVGVCSLCPPGSEAPNTGTGNKCQACPEGTFSSKTESRTAENTMDEAGGVTCLGCPTGTRTGDDGRIICGRAGFEESFIKVIETQKALVGAWLSCFVLAAGGFLWVRRKYPTADASIVLEAVASMLELILDANFLHLLTSEGRRTYFAIALTGFCSHLVLNMAIIAVFMHHEVQRADIRQWAFKNVNALAVAVMISVPNPRLLEILSSRIGSSTTWTRAPFSHQAEIALRFCTFLASIVGKVPQVGVDILILQKDGWHLNPLLASITNSAMLLRGIIYYLILNILYLYTKRLGGVETAKDGADGKGATGSNPYPAETSQREVDLERARRELAMARKKVKELEAKFGPLDAEEGYPNALSSYKIAESLSRRPSGAHVNGDGLP